MHRILVVDDEPHVVHGLRDLIDDEFGYDVDVYTASDGLGALAMMHEASFDLLIADIMMPKLDGMGLLEQTKSRWPSCRVILFTGHGNFDDLYTANKYQDVTYLLKTIDDEELCSIIRKELTEIERRNSFEEMENRIKKLVPEAVLIMQQRLLSALLSGRAGFDGTLQNRFDDLEIPLQSRRAVLPVLCRCSSDFRPELPWAVLSLVRDRVPSGVSVVAVDVEDPAGIFFMLFQRRSEKRDEDVIGSFSRLVLQALDPVSHNFQGEDEVRTMSIASEQEVNWLELPEKCRALQFLSATIDMEPGRVVCESVVQERITGYAGCRRYSVDYDMFPILYSYMESHDIQGIQERLYSLVSEADLGEALHLQAKIEICSALDYFFVNFASRRGLNYVALLAERKQHAVPDVAELPADEVCDYYTGIARSVIAADRQRQAPLPVGPADAVCRYIDGHLDKDLSLVRLADRVDLNPTYFSRLFRTVKGMTVLEYTNARKIDRARHLLTETNMRIQDVSEAVGFTSANYFSRFFRKYTGKSPNEFKSET